MQCPRQRNRLPNEDILTPAWQHGRVWCIEEMSLNQTDFAELRELSEVPSFGYSCPTLLTHAGECLEQNDDIMPSCAAPAPRIRAQSVCKCFENIHAKRWSKRSKSPERRTFPDALRPGVDRANPEEADLIFRALSQFHRSSGLIGRF